MDLLQDCCVRLRQVNWQQIISFHLLAESGLEYCGDTVFETEV